MPPPKTATFYVLNLNDDLQFSEILPDSFIQYKRLYIVIYNYEILA